MKSGVNEENLPVPLGEPTGLGVAPTLGFIRRADGHRRREVKAMKKPLLILLLVALATPMFVSVLHGLGPTTANAQDDDPGDDCQGDEDGETCLP